MDTSEDLGVSLSRKISLVFADDLHNSRFVSSSDGIPQVLSCSECHYLWEEAKHTNRVRKLSTYFRDSTSLLLQGLEEDDLTEKDKAAILNFLNWSGAVSVNVVTARNRNPQPQQQSDHRELRLQYEIDCSEDNVSCGRTSCDMVCFSKQKRTSEHCHGHGSVSQKHHQNENRCEQRFDSAGSVHGNSVSSDLSSPENLPVTNGIRVVNLPHATNRTNTSGQSAKRTVDIQPELAEENGTTGESMECEAIDEICEDRVEVHNRKYSSGVIQQKFENSERHPTSSQCVTVQRLIEGDSSGEVKVETDKCREDCQFTAVQKTVEVDCGNGYGVNNVAVDGEEGEWIVREQGTIVEQTSQDVSFFTQWSEIQREPSTCSQPNNGTFPDSGQLSHFSGTVCHEAGNTWEGVPAGAETVDRIFRMMPTSGKRKRVEISDAIKRSLCQFKELHPHESYAKVVEYAKEEHNIEIGRSTVYEILRGKDKWLNMTNASPTKMRHKPPKFPKLEKALILWLRDIDYVTFPISDEMLRRKAKEFGEQLGVTNFAYSNGWLTNMKMRFGFLRKRKQTASNTAHINEDTSPQRGITNQ